MDNEVFELPSVREALLAVFGSARVTQAQPISGGASGAALYRVQVGSRLAVLRLDRARDAFRDPRRAYTCMRLAAEAGVAPALHYADPEAGVVIMDFVPCRALRDYPGGEAALVRALGELIARLQTTPAFPTLIDYPILLDRLLAMLSGSGLFSPGILDIHRAGFDRIRAAYPWGTAQLSSHNDLNPTNILFDGARLWFVDWEIAYRNDPLLDIAVVAENFAPTGELEAILLAAAGCKADRTLRARLLLMRQLSRLYYGCLLLSAGIGRRPMSSDLSAHTLGELRELHDRGSLTTGTPESLHALGKAYLAAFIAGLETPECRAALAAFGVS